MHTILKSLLKHNWLPYLTLLLWLGAYSQLVGAKPMMRGVFGITPQVLYWMATIGALLILAGMTAKLFYQVVLWVKNKDKAQRTVDEINKEIREYFQKGKS
jgi:hypothetical protein